MNNIDLPPACPDPERAYKNIETFLSENPDYNERLKSRLSEVSMLFSCSQFLANYCIQHPDELFHALNNLDVSFDMEHLKGELRELFRTCVSMDDGMKAVRIFKKNKLLIITLKDILKKADLQELMLDMSSLADAILSEALEFTEPFIRQRYGLPENNSLTVIGLGKLGAQELNYSSDVDIIFAYREEGETTGVSTVQGTVMNRISAFEYYTKLVEEYTRFLSANTGDGFVYRVDLRLRPQGQRGSLALSLRGHEEYYESWGQLWERAALLRARTVAGDVTLGNEFLEMLKPFVYRKYLGFDAIDEIRRMKSQVEHIKPGTMSRDIKRGYGGIREIEFFIQIFQLIYGGREVLLRERSTLKSLHRLLQKGLIGYEDFHHLTDNYNFLRTLEHRLQQLNDLQTHALPSGDRELDILAGKMGFSERISFLSELEARRHRVREIYDSLLEVRGRRAEEAEEPHEGLLSNIFWDMETPIEHLLSEALSKTGIRDIHKAVHCLMKIRNTINFFQTIRGRRLLENIIPRFVDEALKSADPDLALLHLVDFSALMATKESYLEAISQKHEIISILNFIFSHSEYLSKILMSNPEYLDSLVEGEVRKKTLTGLKKELKLLAETHEESTAIRLFRRLEEIRLGILFLDRKINVLQLMKSLSRVAEAALLALLKGQGAWGMGHGQDNPPLPPFSKGGNRGDLNSELTIIGFGKLGGREITFNSDLDLIFVTLNDPAAEDIKAAERLLKISMSYTKDGMAYRMDTRLRPEGSKGPLVSSIRGLEDYYLKHARTWELQALLKARPVAGDVYACRRFMDMRRNVLIRRGMAVTIDDIKRMRERINRELSRELLSAGIYDVKLGSGGLEDLEFMIQYLQIRNCQNNPGLLVQDTLAAIRRLNINGILNAVDAMMFSDIYIFYRTIETILRLRNESVLKEGSNTFKTMIDIMDTDEEIFLTSFKKRRQWVSDFWSKAGISEV